MTIDPRHWEKEVLKDKVESGSPYTNRLNNMSMSMQLVSYQIVYRDSQNLRNYLCFVL